MTGSNEKRGPFLWIIAALAVIGIGVAMFMLLSGGNTPHDREEGTPGAPKEPTERVVDPLQNVSAPPLEQASARNEAKPTGPKPPVAASPMPASFEKALSGISGRVVEPSGEPVAGARVELIGGLMELATADLNTLLFDPESFDPNLIQQKVTTDGSGKFNFTKVDPRLFHMLGINLGYGRPHLRIIDQLPNPTESLDLGDIALDPPLLLTGKVVTEAGNKPVGGARVRATAIPKVAFDAGIAHMNPDTTLMFEARPFGRQLWKMPAWMRNYWDKLPFPTVNTASDGTFKIEGAPAGELTIVVETAGYPPATHRVTSSTGAQKDVGEIVVPTGESVDGSVVDESGNPVANAEVMPGIICPLEDSVTFLKKSITADASGRFTLRGLTGKKFRAAARAPGHVDWTWNEKDFEMTGDEIVIKIPGPKSVNLVVKDESGKPQQLKMASVAAQLRDGPGMFPQLFPPSRVKLLSVEDGKYRIDGLRKGKFTIYAAADGFAVAQVDVEIGDDAETSVPITLSPERFIKITVTGREGSGFVPMEGVNVGSTPHGSGEMDRRGFSSISSTRTAADGIARLRAMGNGVHWIGVSHPAYAAETKKVTIPETTELSFHMIHGGTIEGRLHNAGKTPDSPKLVVCSFQNKDIDDPEPLAFPRMMVTRADGTFKFTHLTPGTYQVELSPIRVGDKNLAGNVSNIFLGAAMFFEDRVSRTVEVKDEETTQVDLDTNKTREATPEDGRIRGIVTVNGAPYADAGIVIYGNEYKRVKTNAAGEFDSGPIKVGDWMQVALQSKDNDSGWSHLATRTVNVKAGEETTVRIDIHLAGPLRGIVKSAATGKPISLANVQAHKIMVPKKRADGAITIADEVSSSLNVTSDDKGEFTFSELLEGDYNVTAQASGHAKSPNVKVNISVGATPEPLVILLNDGTRVTGSVTYEGQSKDKWAGLSFMSMGGSEGNYHSEWAQLEQGKFSINTISEGKYRIRLQVWSQTENGDYSSDEGDVFDEIELSVPASGLSDISLSFVKKKKSATPAPAPAIK